MQLRILSALTIGGLLFFGSRAAKPLFAFDKAAARPVIVELFTSEGCSSCPPADALLRKLSATQPVPGVEIIVLGEHVDYWNYIGWTDRFSSKQFTQRQQQYAEIFHLDSAYTPQMVVDGRVELNGADEASAKHEIIQAAKQARVPVTIAVKSLTSRVAVFTVHVSASPLTKNSHLLLAVTESGLTSEIKAGENDGRKLVHSGVVHVLRQVDELKGGELDAEPAIEFSPEWKMDALNVVVFIQEKNSRRIVGAASQSFRLE
jgi:hypothetical protein